MSDTHAIEGSGGGEGEEAFSTPLSSPTISTPPISLDALLALGRSLNSEYSSDPRPAVREELQAVMGLLAYSDPEKEASGRTRELLSTAEREKVAEEVNRAVLRTLSFLFSAFLSTFAAELTGNLPFSSSSSASARLEIHRLICSSSHPPFTIFNASPVASSLPPVPALEQLFRHTAASIQLAGDLGSGSAAMVDVRKELFEGL
jgi:hypothetical protein